MSLGTTLANLRKNAGMTQGELGAKLNISAQAISKWENGISEPDITTVKKIADIYGVTVNDIVDPEGSPKANAVKQENSEGSIFSSLSDVYLTAINPNKKISCIRYLMEMLGIGLAEAKLGVESLPYLISGNVSAEESDRIVSYMAEVGATVAKEPSSGQNRYRKIISTQTPEAPKPDHTMRNRFITANITAGIPAIALLVISILMSLDSSTLFLDVLISVYFCACIYSLIFLMWYPTVTRKLMAPYRLLNFDGFFSSIGSAILAILFSPWLIIVGLISPINYAFAIKTRVVRMMEEDWDDDIFSL